MLTAQEAQQQSEQSSQSQLEMELQKISEEIEQTAEKGNQKIIIERQHTSPEEQKLNKQIMHELYKHGYTIRYCEWIIVVKKFIDIEITW